MSAARVPIAEVDFMATVVEAARLLGWYCYHPHRSQHSEEGFPDLVIVKPPRLVFAELKAGSNRPTPAQRAWLEALGGCPGVQACVWTPADWDAIERVLVECPECPELGA